MKSHHTFTTKLWHQPINKTTLFKRWPHIQNVIQTNAKIPTPINLAHIIPAAPRFSYISWGGIFLAYNARIWGGGFRLAIMRVYICGKIFALHNTHIKTWRKSQNHNAKDCLESIKIFRQKMYMCGRFLKASCNTPILDPNHFFTLTIYLTKEPFTFQNRRSKNLEQKWQLRKIKESKTMIDYHTTKSNLLSDAK